MDDLPGGSLFAARAGVKPQPLRAGRELPFHCSAGCGPAALPPRFALLGPLGGLASRGEGPAGPG